MKKLILFFTIFGVLYSQQVFDSDQIDETLEFKEDIKKSLSKLLKQENCWDSYGLVEVNSSLEGIINQMLHINNYNIIRSRARKIGSKGVDVHHYTAGVYGFAVDEYERLAEKISKDIDLFIDQYDKSTLLLLNDLKKHVRKLNRLVD